MRCLSLVALTLFACTPEKTTPETGTPQDTGGETGGPDDTAGEAPAPASEELCDRLMAGAGSLDSPVLALSAAHATERLFGQSEDFEVPDAALVDAIAAGGVQTPDLAGYADALGLCLLSEDSRTLGGAVVGTHGDVAWVSPGTGEVSLPEGTAAVVIDLRGLPADPDLPAALAAAAGAALATDVPGLREQVRQWDGMVDQVFSRGNAYSTEVVTQDLDGVAAAGAVDLPLVLVTDDRLPPEAAAFAATLAAAGRAWIVGEDVMSEVGEMSWAGLDGEGLMMVTRRLMGADGCLPDTVPATLRTADPYGDLDGVDLSSWEPPAALSGECTRAEVPERRPFAEGARAERSDEATFEAGLIIAHGNLRRFFPYFDTVGDTIDDRLLAQLEVVPLERSGQVKQLGGLGAALHDGHVFFGDEYETDAVGYLPVTLDHIDGRPVVVQSNIAQLQPGDTITAVDGEPIEDLYAVWSAYHGAATEGYALDMAGRELWYMYGTTTYTVEDPDGVSREEVIEPQSADLFSDLPFAFHTQPSRMLDDLGAPDIAYLNLSDAVTTEYSQVEDLFAEAAGASGLVVDMRGYPGVDIYSVAAMLHAEAFGSPVFRTHIWTGPEDLHVQEVQYVLDPIEGGFYGPLVLLTSPITVSAAENFGMMLVDLPNLTVVGRNSAGTNGNVTGMQLPGGFYLTFTGMEVLFPDGSTFHGVGMVPDVEVVPTAADYRDGLDPELTAAVELLEAE